MLAPGPHDSGRRSRVLAGLLAVAVLVPGCALTQKNEQGRLLHAAPEVLARSAGVQLSLAVSSRVSRKGALTTLPAADPGLRLEGQLDLRTERASYTEGGRTVAVFDGKRAFARRPNARPSDARPWVQVSVDEDLQDRVLDPAALRPSLAALALRPSVLVDSFVGALTGSIENEGPDEVDGVATTRYTARVDLLQALAKSERRRYSQREQDDLAQLFEVLGIEEDALHDGTMWLDDEGAPRRLLLSLHEEPAPESLVLVTLDLRMTPRAEAVAIAVPGQNTVTTVPSLFQYLQPLASSAASA